MALFIDQPVWQARGRLWSHLVSDTSLEQLHEFAESVGLPRQAFHRDHYDVLSDRFEDVVAAGAQPVTSRDVVRKLYQANLRTRPHRAPPN